MTRQHQPVTGEHATEKRNSTTFDSQTLTDRQQRELDYHKEYADSHRHLLSEPFNYDVVEDTSRRWWNQYWEMFTYLLNNNLQGKQVLVVGCGFGSDAINLSRAGATVSAFDLSPESLDIARALAARENLSIDFRQLPAEQLDYTDNSFDIIVARDILHHVNIPEVMAEIKRVGKRDSIFCFNEVYSHSLLHKIRYSSVIDKWLYPKMVSFIYGDRPYITDDEERLSQIEVKQLLSELENIEVCRYFNAAVTRVIPDRFKLISKLDQLLLRWMPFVAPVLGSRVLVGGKLN